MKKILNLLIAALAGTLLLVSFKEDDTTGFSRYVFNPNHAGRGERITFLGEGLDGVRSIVFAGGAEVTEIVRKGSSLEVVVPMAAQPGYIELRYAGGSYTTRSMLELEERLSGGAELNLYTDFEALTSGVTTVGAKVYITTQHETDYLSDIRRVEFAGDEAVVEWDAAAVEAAGGAEARTDAELVALSEKVDFVRGAHLLIVTVPRTARSGAVTLYNGDDDAFTTPEVSIAQSVAESVSPSEAVIPGLTRLTVAGENFSLVTKVVFTGGAEVALGAIDEEENPLLEIAEDGRSLTVATVVGMQDGPLALHTLSGEVIATPSVETVVPTRLSAWALDDRYKAGDVMTLSCDDTADAATDFRILTQIAKVLFAKADGSQIEASFEASEEYGCLNVTVPSEAVDGAVCVETHAGKQATAVEALTLVRAVPTGLAPASVEAGAPFSVLGTDLDLVSGVTLSGEKMEFSVSGDGAELVVRTLTTSAGGRVVLTQANGLTVEVADDLTVEAPAVLTVTNLPLDGKPGAQVTLEGFLLDLTDRLYVGGIKIRDFAATPTTLAFALPEVLGSGDHAVVIYDFDDNAYEAGFITVKLGQKTETLWSGRFDLAAAAWNVQLVEAAKFASIPDDAVYTCTVEPAAAGAQLTFKNAADWAFLPSATPDDPQWGCYSLQPGETSYAFTLSAEDLAKVRANGMYLSGQQVVVTAFTATYASADAGGVEPMLPTDILLNDFETHGDHNSSWDGSWSDGSATEFLTEEGNTYLRTTKPLSGWIVNCNHQTESGGAFGAPVDDLSRYVVKFALKIDPGVTGLSAVAMQVVLGDGWFWYGEGLFPETTDGEWITVTVSSDAIAGAKDLTSGTNGLYSDGAVPAGVCIDNFRLSLK
ncbi:MAG: hypothetical protein K2N93_05580 [Alistipes sp.]|nr:hypothetical protein [Alistipes sp.]